MAVTAGSVHRPATGRSGSVVVRVVGPSSVGVDPWPQKGRRRAARKTVALAAGGNALVGYTATGERG